jgi:Tfp pilus assembly protein PilZ
MTTAVRSHRLRCVRSSVALSAEIKPVDGAVSFDDFSQILNLSGSGCLLESEKSFAVGDVVFLRFSLPGCKEVETEARVARVSDLGNPHRTRGLGSPALVTPARPNNEDGSQHEDRFAIGLSFSNMEERTSELIVSHVLREAARRRN